MGYIEHASGFSAALETFDPSASLTVELLGSVDGYVGIEVSVLHQSTAGMASFNTTLVDLKDFANALEGSGPAEILDRDSEAYIRVAPSDGLGHWAVDVRVGGSWQNYARTLFSVDQTVIPKFVSGIRKIISGVEK